jgi:hypothetical protein
MPVAAGIDGHTEDTMPRLTLDTIAQRLRASAEANAAYYKFDLRDGECQIRRVARLTAQDPIMLAYELGAAHAKIDTAERIENRTI